MTEKNKHRNINRWGSQLSEFEDGMDREDLLKELRVKALQTKLKEKEHQETKEWGRRYRLLFNLAPVGYLILDKEGGIIEANLTAAEIFGVTKVDLEEKDFYTFIPTEYRDKFFLHLRQLRKEERAVSDEFPLLYQGENRGWMKVNTIRLSGEDPAVYRVALTDITDRKEYEERLEKSYRTIREMSRNLENAREEERKRIARELHDKLGQTLTALQLDLQWLERRADGEHESEINRKLDQMKEMVVEMVEFSKHLSREMRPELIENAGLLSAVQWQLEQFQERTGISYTLDATDEKYDLSDEMALSVFRVFQEALTNVARHSSAQKVQVKLSQADEAFVLTVSDSGKGFIVEELDRGNYGLMSMQERVLQWDGDVTIDSDPGQGTVLKVNIPLDNIM